MGNAVSDEYGIGAVAKLTGLSDHTIRVWERRYGAVAVGRSASGRRTYTTADVEKLRLLKLLTDRGVAISQIANDSSESLKQRLASMDDISTRAGLERLSVALAGDFLPTQVSAYQGPLDFRLVGSDLARFEADLKHAPVDALVLELPTITPERIDWIRALKAEAKARHCVVVYTFGRRRDTEALTNEGVTMLRAPVRLTDVASALIKLMVIADPVKPTTPEPPAESPADFPDAGQPAPRRFTREQLAALAEISSAIDCECPQHLAQLVAELTAFELYSAACAHRDEDDRALHEYLHATTAMARSRIEDALDRVVRAEGITV